MYSTGVDYSTLSISSLPRYAETTLPHYPRHHQQAPPPIWRRRRPRQRATARRLVTIDQALLVTMGALLMVRTLSLAVGVAKGQLGHDQRQFTAYDRTSPQELKGHNKGQTSTMPGQAGSGPGLPEEPNLPAPTEGHLPQTAGVTMQGPEDEGRASLR
jgi:hypothetical protein